MSERLSERTRSTIRLIAAIGTAVAVVFALLRFVDVDHTLLLGVVPVAPLAVCGGVLVLAAVTNWRAFAATLAAVVLVALLAMPGAVLPRTGCDVTADRDESSVVVFSHNTLVGNPASSDVAQQLLNVDPGLVLLQEAPGPFVDALEAELGDRYPHRETAGLQTILSRWPLSDTVTTGTSTGGALIATMTSPAAVIRVANFHASAPVLPERRMNQRREFADMAQWRTTENVDLVMGDFNAGGAQPLFRDVVSDGFVDAHRRAGCGFGLTWSRSGIALLSLDHALVGDGYTTESFEVFDYQSSDHKAVAVHIRPVDE